MRLLLDEMYPPSLAKALRDNGHDVVALKERQDLIGSLDEELLVAASAMRRTLLTENADDLMRLVHQFAAEGRSHHGVLFVASRSLSRADRARGELIRAIERYLAVHPGEDALIDAWDWLTPATSL